MRFGSTPKVTAKQMLKSYRISCCRGISLVSACLQHNACSLVCLFFQTAAPELHTLVSELRLACSHCLQGYTCYGT